MQVSTLDGRKYNWKIPEKLSKGNKRQTSKLHSTTRELIKQVYPTCRFYEEVPIVVEGKKKLFLDFYIPTFGLAIEVHGQQHYNFTALYHKNKLDFLMAQANDNKKAEWCALNGINLIVLAYNEKEEEWKIKLENR